MFPNAQERDSGSLVAGRSWIHDTYGNLSYFIAATKYDVSHNAKNTIFSYGSNKKIDS